MYQIQVRKELMGVAKFLFLSVYYAYHVAKATAIKFLAIAEADNMHA